MLAMDKKNTGMSMAIWIIIALMAVGWVLTAWVADDAYITFRTIDHFWKGYGLRWNIDERVQVFTHPLWMMLLSIVGYPFRELYYSSLALSAACVAGTITLLYRHAASQWQLIIGLLVLLSSRAFLDFSSSGLENPLLYLLGTLSCLLIVRDLRESRFSLLALVLLQSLLFITRMDSILVFFPVILFYITMVYRQRGFAFTFHCLLVGSLPALIWLGFALVYYGMLLPNTAWAKLNTGIGRGQLIAQGMDYYIANLKFDPITLIVIACGLIFLLRSVTPVLKLLGLGIFLNLMYILWIGADYMYGRFLSALFLVCVVIFLSCNSPLIRCSSLLNKMAGLFVCIFVFVFFLLSARHWNPLSLEPLINEKNGMADERSFYSFTESFFRKIIGKSASPYFTYVWKDNPETLSPDRIRVAMNIGIYSYLAPDTVYFVDPLALSDPFLAQHPMRPGYWRQGHFERYVPFNYFVSVRTKNNVMGDLNDKQVLSDVWLLSRSSINAPGRWRAIWRVNTGQTRRQAWKAFKDYTAQTVVNDPYFRKMSDRVWYGPYRP